MLQRDTNELAEVPPSSFWPPADAESLMKNAIGYAASKWMGEILLERAEGVPAVVHRFPNIMGPTSTRVDAEGEGFGHAKGCRGNLDWD
jgi:nucleoside-diphosphate-sugar epimerase